MEVTLHSFPKTHVRNIFAVAAFSIALIVIAGCGGSASPKSAFAASPSTPAPGASAGVPSSPPPATPPPSSTPGPTSPPSNSGPYQANITATAQWFAATTQAPDGAILYGSSAINPYYSNLAAIGLTHDPGSYGMVQHWMQWYVGHLNWPDKWGL